MLVRITGFRKSTFWLIFLFYINPCFGAFIKDVSLNSDLLQYKVSVPASVKILYHIRHKRDLLNKRDVTDASITAQNVTVPSVSTVTKNSTLNEKEPTTTQPSNSLYDADSGTEDELKLEGFNSTATFAKYDHHRYYRSYSKSGMKEVVQYWVDLDQMSEEKVIAHHSLSSAYRRALTVSLTFDFPFYGHILRNVTIATGGFLFTGAFLHKWLAATQYIAPLMANFDTSASPDAMVKYMDNGTSLTVQWEKVVLQDNTDAGPFTFQVTIHKSGHIIFAYKDIPVTVTLIQDMKHPVKVGLSDAYIVEKTIFYVRKKTIYEYHKIDIKNGMEIGNWTAIVFEPLLMCLSFNSCDSCLTSTTSFKCEWCPVVRRCSDGMDRHRQDWLEGSCDVSSIDNATLCSTLPPASTVTPFNAETAVSGASVNIRSQEAHSGHSNVWIGFFMTIVVIAFIGGWVAYAYLHPHTASGQILIKYRPSAWSWRRGEARYTAATMHSIHM